MAPSCSKFWTTEYVLGARKSLAAIDMPDALGLLPPAVFIEYTTPRYGPCRRSPQNRRTGSRIAASADGRCDEVRPGLERLPRVPGILAHRSAVLCKDAAGSAQQGRLDREEVRWQGVTLFRPPAACAICDQAGARRSRAVLYLRSRWPRRLSGQHLRSAAPAVVQPDVTDFA